MSPACCNEEQLSVGQSKLPLQFETGPFKGIFNIVSNDALSADDLRIPVSEPSFRSKNTDIEIVNVRTVLFLQRGSQHFLKLFRVLQRLFRA